LAEAPKVDRRSFMKKEWSTESHVTVRSLPRDHMRSRRPRIAVDNDVLFDVRPIVVAVCRWCRYEVDLIR
jgi:hypothetical protein